MKSHNFLIVFTVAAMATASAMGETLFSPRAAGNQTRTTGSYNADPNLATPGLTAVAPRVQDNQSKTVPGKSASETPSVKSSSRKAVSPKMMGNCAATSGDSISCCSAPTPIPASKAK